MSTPKVRNAPDGVAIEIEFRPGEWAQACAFFTTKWTYPDQEGNNKALAAACDGLPELIVRAVNSHDTLLEALRNALDGLKFYDKGPLAEATIKFGEAAILKAKQ